MDYIYICLLLSRQSESDNIYNSFGKFISIKHYHFKLISSETLRFFYHISDLASLYYITYLYQRTQKEEDEQTKEFMEILFLILKQI